MALYEKPANLFVATFLGSPKMNLLQGELRHGDEGLRLRMGDDVELPLSPGEDTRDALKPLVGKRLTMGLRPEDMRINGERSEEHTSELQSLMRHSYAVFCLNKQKHTQ